MKNWRRIYFRNEFFRFIVNLDKVIVADSLIKAGGIVSAINIMGETPLFWAAKRGNDLMSFIRVYLSILVHNGT